MVLLDQKTPSSTSGRSRRKLLLRIVASQQTALVGLLAAEIVIFSIIGTNFFSRGNAFEIIRLSVEVGLLAVALTPVIITGGIDLSVGSLIALCAVLFGMMWRDAH